MAVDSRDDLLSWIGGAIAPPPEGRKQMSDIILCEAEAAASVQVPGRVVDVETESTADRTVVPAPAGEEDCVCAGPEAVTRGA